MTLDLDFFLPLLMAWNVRSMNKGKLEVVKQEMATVNVNILGNSKLKMDRNG